MGTTDLTDDIQRIRAYIVKLEQTVSGFQRHAMFREPFVPCESPLATRCGLCLEKEAQHD